MSPGRVGHFLVAAIADSGNSDVVTHQSNSPNLSSEAVTCPTHFISLAPSPQEVFTEWSKYSQKCKIKR